MIFELRAIPVRLRPATDHLLGWNCGLRLYLVLFGYDVTLFVATRSQQRVYTYLTMTVGQRAGTCYSFDGGSEFRIGRGTELRRHADGPALFARACHHWRQDNNWRMHDAESRNGTFVNGQKVGSKAWA